MDESFPRRSSRVPSGSCVTESVPAGAGCPVRPWGALSREGGPCTPPPPPSSARGLPPAPARVAPRPRPRPRRSCSLSSRLDVLSPDRFGRTPPLRSPAGPVPVSRRARLLHARVGRACVFRLSALRDSRRQRAGGAMSTRSLAPLPGSRAAAAVSAAGLSTRPPARTLLLLSSRPA